ncbi:hypothetical protein BDY21DRAFT_273470, partial [Lineolata rhizophorae]
SNVTYEELVQIEYEFDDVELEIIRQQTALNAPLYAKRQAVTSRIPNFWPLVFEQGPSDIGQMIQPTDSEIFAECLTGFSVSRFELPGGSPRSVAIRFEFDASKNKWFADEVLEKKFWFRRARDGWTGLVSEPLKVQWREGMDITDGLTDAAVGLWEARKELLAAQKGGPAAAPPPGAVQALPQFKALADKLDNSDEGARSIFAFFGFIKKGEKVQEEKPAGEEPEEDEVDADICPVADELAMTFADDMWPNAIKYFTAAQEMDMDNMSHDFEGTDEDVDDDEDDEDEQIDIRSLVKGKEKGSDSPPAKRRK